MEITKIRVNTQSNKTLLMSYQMPNTVKDKFAKEYKVIVDLTKEHSIVTQRVIDECNLMTNNNVVYVIDACFDESEFEGMTDYLTCIMREGLIEEENIDAILGKDIFQIIHAEKIIILNELEKHLNCIKLICKQKELEEKNEPKDLQKNTSYLELLMKIEKLLKGIALFKNRRISLKLFNTPELDEFYGEEQ